jgi:hypothetical protein
VPGKDKAFELKLKNHENKRKKKSGESDTFVSFLTLEEIFSVLPHLVHCLLSFY